MACNRYPGSIVISTQGTMELTKNERREVLREANARNGRADLGRRTRWVLLRADGCTWAVIRDKLDCNDSYASGCIPPVCCGPNASAIARRRHRN